MPTTLHKRTTNPVELKIRPYFRSDRAIRQVFSVEQNYWRRSSFSISLLNPCRCGNDCNSRSWIMHEKRFTRCQSHFWLAFAVPFCESTLLAVQSLGRILRVIVTARVLRLEAIYSWASDMTVFFVLLKVHEYEPFLVLHGYESICRRSYTLSSCVGAQGKWHSS